MVPGIHGHQTYHTWRPRPNLTQALSETNPPTPADATTKPGAALAHDGVVERADLALHLGGCTTRGADAGAEDLKTQGIQANHDVAGNQWFQRLKP